MRHARADLPISRRMKLAKYVSSKEFFMSFTPYFLLVDEE